jgi:hypothetical protein
MLLHSFYCCSAKFESGRAAVLSVHGTEEFSLTTTAFDAAAYEEAMELPAKQAGECKSFGNGKMSGRA